MSKNSDQERLRKDLRAILGDGLGFSLMVGLGETYVPAFVLALGMGEIAAGWIVSAPLLLGAMLQLASPPAVRWLGSHRRWVVLNATLQAVCCAAYAALALLEGLPHWLVFVVAALYWGTGLAGGPAWNTWVGTLIPRAIRARYLARRGRWCQFAVLLGLVAGGLALQHLPRAGGLFAVFAAMFLLSALFRAASTFCLWRQSEPQPLPANLRAVSPGELLGRVRRGADMQLLAFMLAVQAAVQIAAPFFTPFMLGELALPYATYLLIIAAAYVAKMLAFPFLGLLAKRIGSHRLLYSCAIGIVPLSTLWVFSANVAYLLVLQVVAGVIWAGYELATLLLLFERIDEAERTSVLTLFNVGNALAMVGGVLFGGLLLELLGTDRAAYHVVFAASGAARLLAVVLVARLKRVRFTPRPLAAQVDGVRPNTGSIGTPLVTSLSEDGPREAP
ncbi:MAG: MFS transporter [Planctomycetes bacterium]|nr:MFS transporter [Planctomycetota bacterium]